MLAIPVALAATLYARFFAGYWLGDDFGALASGLRTAQQGETLRAGMGAPLRARRVRRRVLPTGDECRRALQRRAGRHAFRRLVRRQFRDAPGERRAGRDCRGHACAGVRPRRPPRRRGRSVPVRCVPAAGRRRILDFSACRRRGDAADARGDARVGPRARIGCGGLRGSPMRARSARLQGIGSGVPVADRARRVRVAVAAGARADRFDRRVLRVRRAVFRNARTSVRRHLARVSDQRRGVARRAVPACDRLAAPVVARAVAVRAAAAGTAYVVALAIAMATVLLATRGGQRLLAAALFMASVGLCAATLMNLGGMNPSGEGGRLAYSPFAWLALALGVASAKPLAGADRPATSASRRAGVAALVAGDDHRDVRARA